MKVYVLFGSCDGEMFIDKIFSDLSLMEIYLIKTLGDNFGGIVKFCDQDFGFVMSNYKPENGVTYTYEIHDYVDY